MEPDALGSAENGGGWGEVEHEARVLVEQDAVFAVCLEQLLGTGFLGSEDDYAASTRNREILTHVLCNPESYFRCCLGWTHWPHLV